MWIEFAQPFTTGQKERPGPAVDCRPGQLALDETVAKVNGERFWLFGPVDPETGRILHIRLFPHCTIVTTKIFLVDGAPWLQAALFERGLEFLFEKFDDRNPVERASQEVKRGTEQFYNTFSHADPEITDQWPKALA